MIPPRLLRLLPLSILFTHAYLVRSFVYLPVHCHTFTTLRCTTSHYTTATAAHISHTLHFTLHTSSPIRLSALPHAHLHFIPSPTDFTFPILLIALHHLFIHYHARYMLLYVYDFTCAFLISHSICSGDLRLFDYGVVTVTFVTTFTGYVAVWYIAGLYGRVTIPVTFVTGVHSHWNYTFVDVPFVCYTPTMLGIYVTTLHFL